MTLLVQHRITHFGLAVVARQEYSGAKVDGAAPEFRQHSALKPEAFYPRGIGRNLDRRDYLVTDQSDAIAFTSIEGHTLWRAVEVARRAIPVLPLPAVVVHPDHVAVGAPKLRINVDESLHIVVSARNQRQARNGRTQIGSVDHGGLARRELFDITPKKRHTQTANLQTWLPFVVAGDHHIYAACDRSVVGGCGKGDLKPRLRGHAGDRGQGETGGKSDHERYSTRSPILGYCGAGLNLRAIGSAPAA